MFYCKGFEPVNVPEIPNWLIVAALLAWYFLPSVIAVGKKRNAFAIFILNLLLGWTVLGWIIALIWSLTHDQPRKT